MLFITKHKFLATHLANFKTNVLIEYHQKVYYFYACLGMAAGKHYNVFALHKPIMFCRRKLCVEKASPAIYNITVVYVPSLGVLGIGP